MQRINFKDGTLKTSGYATDNSGNHLPVTEAVYEGDTPLSAYMLNKLQDNVEAETNKIVTTIATTSENGLMSSSDKTKLNGIATGANKTTVLNNLTSTSTTSALSASQGKILNDKIGNLIEEGSNTNGSYIKFSSGTMICTKKVPFENLNISNPWGALYVSLGIDLGDFAEPFIDTPVVSLHIEASSSVLKLNAIPQTKSNAGTIQLACAISGSVTVGNINITAIGSWK